MIKSKKQMFLTIIIFTLVMMLGTISYAFFNYTRTGSSNNVRVGRLYFNSNQSETVNLTNAFPIERTNVNTDTDNVDVFEIEIVGDADYENGIEYLVSIENTNIYTSEGKVIPIGLDVTVTNLGNEEPNYFTERNDKDTTIYKRMTGDSIIGDQPLLVGFIKPNTTSGTIEGVNGKITIKAFIDDSKIAITNTYNGMESDEMGTTTSWVDDRVVVTESEWNSLHSTGINFQVKVEANDGVWVEKPFYDTLLSSSVMDNINSDYVDNEEPGIDFKSIASDTNGKGLYTLSSTSSDAYPVLYYRGAVTDNNVKFADKCWKIIRTTDTGGIKMIYNGEYTDENKCNNTGTDTQITVDIDNTPTNAFPFSGSGRITSLAYAGYMFGITTGSFRVVPESGIYFGSDVTYSNGVYTLVDPQEGLDVNHHYTCYLNTPNGTCSSARYYYNSREYFPLSDGNNIAETIDDALANDTNSYAKDIIEEWYEDNIENTVYSNKVEDTIYCNDRSISTLGGFDPNGGTINNNNSVIFFSAYNRGTILKTASLNCLRKIDSFTVSNPRGNGSLDYPVGLITTDEIVLAGLSLGNGNMDFYLNNGTRYWTFTPGNYLKGGASNYVFDSPSGFLMTYAVHSSYGIRPVISLKQGISLLSGEGSPTNPYIFK